MIYFQWLNKRRTDNKYILQYYKCQRLGQKTPLAIGVVKSVDTV